MSELVKSDKESTSQNCTRSPYHTAHESTEFTSFFFYQQIKTSLCKNHVVTMSAGAFQCEVCIIKRENNNFAWFVLQNRLIHEAAAAANDLKSRPVPHPSRSSRLTLVLTPNMRKYLSLLQLSQDIPFRLRYQYIS